MATFSAETFLKKLADLNNSSPSIQTLSLWLIHHRKHAGEVVKIWKKQIIKAPAKKKLTLMYLANDVIQNSKKKGPEFNQGFSTHLAEVYRHLGSVALDEKTEKGVLRLLQVWQERAVFSSIQISGYRSAYESGAGLSPSESPAVSPPGLFDQTTPSPPGHEPAPKKPRRASESTPEAPERRKSLEDRGKPEVKEVEVEGHREVHVTLSPHSPARDPPEPSELITALQDLDSSASSDAAAREQISGLPPEVSDASLLSRLQDRESGSRLLTQVSDALSLLNDYNSRLAAEMEDRRRVSRMLQDFTQSQKDLLAQAERTLDEYRHKLEKVYLVREELKSHIQNLPDISKLPNVTGGFAPLPSAGDLFS